MASNAGRHEPPAWALNLRRQPRYRALVDGRWRDLTARFAEGAERERLWAELAEENPWLAIAAKRAGRELRNPSFAAQEPRAELSRLPHVERVPWT